MENSGSGNTRAPWIGYQSSEKTVGKNLYSTKIPHGGVKCMFGQGCLPEHAAPAVGSQHTEVSTSQV